MNMGERNTGKKKMKYFDVPGKEKPRRTKNIPHRKHDELQTIFDSVPASIFYKDRENRFIKVNRVFAETMGMKKAELEGKSIFDIYPREEADSYWMDDKEVIASGRSKRNIIEPMDLKDGTTLWVKTDKIPYYDSRGNIVGVIGFTVDITERRKMEEELRELSLTDDLTGLTNRRGFRVIAEQQVKIIQRLKKRMLLMYIDVDELKRINDRFGHSKGDIALKETACLLKETFREADLIARIGGDEFIVLAIQNSSGNDDRRLTTRLQKNVKKWNKRKNFPFNLSLSIGISTYDHQSPCSLDELIDRADRLMYEEKRAKQV